MCPLAARKNFPYTLSSVDVRSAGEARRKKKTIRRRTFSRNGTGRTLLFLHQRLGLLDDQVDRRLFLVLIGIFDRIERLLLILFLFLLRPATKVADELGERAGRVGDELGVGALLSDLAVFDADDVIDRGEEVQGVRDQHAGLVGEGATDGVVEQVLADVGV